jgi:hypothetical protein
MTRRIAAITWTAIVFIVGPYVEQNAVVSTSYNTVNMVKTIEEILGLDPLSSRMRPYRSAFRTEAWRAPSSANLSSAGTAAAAGEMTCRE